MEWIAVSIGIGLLVSLLFTEWYGLTVGGMIVPGYLAIHCDRPGTVLLTLAAAILTFGLIRLIHRRSILFGRRRVVLTMVTGFAVASLLRAAALPWQPDNIVEAELATVTVIGFVIPGLIALWIDRAGVVQTLSPLIVATTLVRLVLIVFVGNLIP